MIKRNFPAVWKHSFNLNSAFSERISTIQSKTENHTYSMNQSSAENFFAGVMHWDGLKFFYLVFQIIITVVGPCLLHSIYWYERFSAELHYRTLLNQLISHFCLLSIAGCIFARFPYVLILFFWSIFSTCLWLNYSNWKVHIFMCSHWNYYSANHKVPLHFSKESGGCEWWFCCCFHHHMQPDFKRLFMSCHLHDWISYFRGRLSYLHRQKSRWKY